MQVALSVPPGLPRVGMDERRLVQAFSNLVENAVQHSPRGGEVVVEARDVRSGGTWVEVSVRDSGPGFGIEDLRRAFEPFYTQRRGGVGLGLAIVQRIVREHGGTVALANLPADAAAEMPAARGAVVTVTLPGVLAD